MKRRLVGMVLATLSLAGVARAQDGPTAFHSLAKTYLEENLRLSPESATQLGDHRFDGNWSDFSPKGLTVMREMNARTLKQLDAISTGNLGEDDAVDADILRTNLQSNLFLYDELKEFEWNPLLYNPGPGLFSLLARDYAPVETRLESLRQRLSTVDVILVAARANLKRPPKLHTETAIAQNKGVIAWLKGDLEAQCKDHAKLREARDSAVKALEAYGGWLEKDLLPCSTGDFRLGKDLWRKKLVFTLESNFTPEQILTRAESELKQTHTDMTAVAHQLYPDAPKGMSEHDLCKTVLDRLAAKHADNKTILQEAREDLASATRFVAEKKLMSLPTEKCNVIEMPEFNRGVAVAYCESPGPLETKGETFFAIAPTPADWTPHRVESFYREYNHAMLNDLTVHEAMPGHFLQLMAANRFQAPTRLRSVFQSGTFVEGWATYAEQVMAREGFGGPEVRMEQLKMRLRLILNAILDQRVHMGTMTQAEGEHFLEEEGFQEEGEAAGKWRRACLTSTQLSTYFVGNLEVNEISRDYTQAHPEMSVGARHDKMLSFGSPAPRYIRRLLHLK